MKSKRDEIYSLRVLESREMVSVRGGTGGWDYEIAEQIGRGVGYGVKKMWRLFKFLSNNLYELQATTQVIYK